MRKGQAAMEFLMTYGWAILVVIAAIAALAYFGVLSPANLLPQRCVGESGMDCLRKPVYDSTAETVSFVIKNNQGFDVVVEALSVDGEKCTAINEFNITGTGIDIDFSDGTTCSGTCTDAAKTISNGAVATITVTCPAFTEGRASDDFVLQFHDTEAATFSQKVTYSLKGNARD